MHTVEGIRSWVVRNPLTGSLDSHGAAPSGPNRAFYIHTGSERTQVVDSQVLRTAGGEARPVDCTSAVIRNDWNPLALALDSETGDGDYIMLRS